MNVEVIAGVSVAVGVLLAVVIVVAVLFVKRWVSLAGCPWLQARLPGCHRRYTLGYSTVVVLYLA